ncbi:MAG: hypothetical protein IJ105_02990 [Bacilli bacterium]|nr:hypothetical protein [Bacilli bacterium]
MKKFLSTIIVFFIIFILTGCGIEDKDEIIKIYRNNEEKFIKASKTGNFKGLKKIHGVRRVEVYNNTATIDFGGEGMGGNSNYYEIQYHRDECCSGFKLNDEFKKSGDGYLYNENEIKGSGDNIIYFEELGNGYYYVEMHF